MYVWGDRRALPLLHAATRTGRFVLKTAGKENVLLPFDSLCLAFDNGHRQRLMLIDSSNYAGSETSLGRIRLDSILPARARDSPQGGNDLRGKQRDIIIASAIRAPLSMQRLIVYFNEYKMCNHFPSHCQSAFLRKAFRVHTE